MRRRAPAVAPALCARARRACGRACRALCTVHGITRARPSRALPCGRAPAVAAVAAVAPVAPRAPVVLPAPAQARAFPPLPAPARPSRPRVTLTHISASLVAPTWAGRAALFLCLGVAPFRQPVGPIPRRRRNRSRTDCISEPNPIGTEPERPRPSETTGCCRRPGLGASRPGGRRVAGGRQFLPAPCRPALASIFLRPRRKFDSSCFGILVRSGLVPGAVVGRVGLVGRGLRHGGIRLYGYRHGRHGNGAGTGTGGNGCHTHARHGTSARVARCNTHTGTARHRPVSGWVARCNRRAERCRDLRLSVK